MCIYIYIYIHAHTLLVYIVVATYILLGKTFRFGDFGRPSSFWSCASFLRLCMRQSWDPSWCPWRLPEKDSMSWTSSEAASQMKRFDQRILGNMKGTFLAEKLAQSSLIVAQHSQKSPARKMLWDAESRQGQYQTCLLRRLASFRGTLSTVCWNLLTSTSTSGYKLFP